MQTDQYGRPVKPFTLALLHDPEFVESLYGEVITNRIVADSATPYSKAVCRGDVPELPEGADPEAEMTDAQVRDYSGFETDPEASRRRWSGMGLGNARPSGGHLKHELA